MIAVRETEGAGLHVGRFFATIDDVQAHYGDRLTHWMMREGTEECVGFVLDSGERYRLVGAPL